MKNKDNMQKWKVTYILLKSYRYMSKKFSAILNSLFLSFLMLFLLSFPLSFFYGFSNFNTYLNSFEFGLVELLDIRIPGVRGMWVYMLLSLIVHATLQAMVVLNVSSKRNTRVTFVESQMYIFPRLHKLIAVSLIELMLAVVLLLLYLGGKQLIEIDYIAAALGLILFCLFFWFYVSASLATFLILEEDYSVFDSIRVSIRLVRGVWWSTFIYGAVTTLLIIKLNDLLNFVNVSYLGDLPLRTDFSTFNWQLELKRTLSFSIELLSNVLYIFYYITIYFWFKYRKLSYRNSKVFRTAIPA